MTDVEITRMRRSTLWLPHVFLPSAVAVALGLVLSLLSAVGIMDIPL